jgi:hypothetical protein
MKTLTQLQKEFAAEKFGIPIDDVHFYISGICYARAAVKTPESAQIISDAVKGKCVNGGWYDGMSLGRITKLFDGDDIWYEVMC